MWIDNRKHLFKSQSIFCKNSLIIRILFLWWRLLSSVQAWPFFLNKSPILVHPDDTVEVLGNLPETQVSHPLKKRRQLALLEVGLLTLLLGVILLRKDEMRIPVQCLELRP